MGGPDFRTTCDIFTTWFSTYRQNDAMKRPHMFLRWVAKCHQLESFLTLGVEKRTFGSTPQPRVQSWQMKVLFFGMPGWPKNDMSSWWWLFLGREDNPRNAQWTHHFFDSVSSHKKISYFPMIIPQKCIFLLILRNVITLPSRWIFITFCKQLLFSQIMMHLWIAKTRITGNQWSDFNSPRKGGRYPQLSSD